MYRIILILFLIFNFSFSLETCSLTPGSYQILVYNSYDTSTDTLHFTLKNVVVTSDYYDVEQTSNFFPDSSTRVDDGVCWYHGSVKTVSTLLVSWDCLEQHGIYNNGNPPHFILYTTSLSKYFSECTYPSTNCTYSYSGQYFICNNNIVCPSGQHYDSKQEKCIDNPTCPDSSTLDQMAIKKCGSLDWTKTEMCDPDTGDINITCKSCSDVVAYVKQYCSVNYDTNISNFSCNENSDGSLSVSVTSDELNSSVCLIKESDTNNSNSDITDNNSNISDSSSDNSSSNVSNSSSSNNISDSSENSSSTVNNSSTNSNVSNNSNNNTCPDPCYLYEHKPLGFQVSTSIVNGYTCNTVTYPVYNNCNVQYHITDGKCVSGCGNNVASGFSGDGNISINLSPVTSRLDKTNQKLSDIDKTLNDIKNMKPDNNLSFGSSEPDAHIKQGADTLTKSLTNFTDTLSTLKGNIDNIINLIKNPDIQFSNLQSNIQTCPIFFNIYNHTQTFDICKFVSPYKPLLQFFFTLFFSLSVILYFFDVVMRSNNKKG